MSYDPFSLCEGPDTSMFCLKHSDCYDWKGTIGRECPGEVGQTCSESTSCSTLRLMLSPPAPLLSSWRKAQRGCLHTCNSRKNLVYIRSMHQVNCKRKWIGPLCALFTFSFTLIVYPSSGPSIWQDQCSI